MDAKKQAERENYTEEESEKLKRASIIKWLIDRVELAGFELDERNLQVKPYRQHVR